ncbi:MAG: hypothetical protein N3D85_07645 [Candidatus Bathyarchaeota archaeon]|nr:hypothetical protein [Candidatus Bathyarchaeota archaeon]
MGAERAIHAAMFVLLLVGLYALSWWVSYHYVQNELALRIASVALSWGVILLVLYLSFRKLNWQWWNKSSA